MASYKTKETALKHIRKGQSFSCKVFDHFREDRDLVLEAVKFDKWAEIPECFYDDFEVAHVACKHGRHHFDNLSPRLRNNREIILAALASDTNVQMKFIDFDDEEVASAYLYANPKMLSHFPESYQLNLPLLAKCAKKTHEVMKNVDITIRDDSTSMNYLISANHNCFIYASERLRSDIKFVEFNCNRHPSLANFVGEQVRKNNSVMTKLIQKYPFVYDKASYEVRSNPELAMEVANSPYYFNYIPRELLNNDSLVDIAMEKSNGERYHALPHEQGLRESNIARYLLNTNSSSSEFLFSLPVQVVQEMGFDGDNWKSCPRSGKEVYEIYKATKLKNSLDSKLATKEETKRTVKI